MYIQGVDEKSFNQRLLNILNHTLIYLLTASIYVKAVLRVGIVVCLATVNSYCLMHSSWTKIIWFKEGLKRFLAWWKASNSDDGTVDQFRLDQNPSYPFSFFTYQLSQTLSLPFLSSPSRQKWLTKIGKSFLEWNRSIHLMEIVRL